ncbi:hypothetical protein [Pseudomonas batumici]|uniref:hypothetical protein n=1 Tax=Pseudomonas batumici TaxID=226910 RepID=UPI0012EE54F6|nr:hypothetical protein [Pseudomonas batumici]
MQKNQASMAVNRMSATTEEVTANTIALRGKSKRERPLTLLQHNETSTMKCAYM